MITESFTGFYQTFQGSSSSGSPLSIRFYPGVIDPYIASKEAFGFISLIISKVTCINETDPETGDDEISAGGSSIDPYLNMTEIGKIDIGDDFDGGEHHDGPWTFCRYPINNSDAVWSKNFSAQIYLSEIDNGGFPEFLTKILEYGKEKIVEYLSTTLGTALGVAIGAGIGSAVPLLGTLIGAAIGAIVGWLVGSVIGKLKEWWEDDNFYPGIATTVFPGPNALFENIEATTEIRQFNYKGYGGEYELQYYWQLHN